MSHFHETPADIEVKRRLWASTEAELLRFAEREAEEFKVGDPYSPGQKDVTSAARRRGYPVGLVRKLARQVRLGEDASEDVMEFRRKLSLNV